MLMAHVVFQVRIAPKHYHETIALAGLTGAKSVSTPAVPSAKPSEKQEIELDEGQHSRYRTLVGRLFSNVDVRLDLLTAVREAARACSKPTIGDMELVKRIVRYLIGTTDYCLTYRHRPMLQDESITVIEVVTDASWGSSRDMRSVSGGLLYLDGVHMAAWSKTQKVVTHSSCESELVAIFTAVLRGQTVEAHSAGDWHSFKDHGEDGQCQFDFVCHEKRCWTYEAS